MGIIVLAGFEFFEGIRPGLAQGGGQSGVWAGAFRIDKTRTIRFEAGQEVRLKFSGAPLALPWPGCLHAVWYNAILLYFR